MSTGILKAPKYTKPVPAPSLETIPDKKSYIAYMNHLLPRDKLLVNDNEPDAKVAFDQSVSDQKDETKVCASGKKANIDRSRLSFVQFLQAIGVDNGMNGLGCGAEAPYVTYENGKYCCADKGIEDQEYFDYINMLLNGAMSNVDDTMFINSIDIIRYLISERTRLLAKNSELVDTIVLPVNINRSVDGQYFDYNSVDDWFRSASAKTGMLKNTPRPMFVEPDREFDKMQRDLAEYNYEKIQNPSYPFPSTAPSRRGLPDKQKSTRMLPNYDEDGHLVEDRSDSDSSSAIGQDSVVEEQVARTAPPARGLKRGGKTRKGGKEGKGRKSKTRNKNKKRTTHRKRK